MTDMKMYAFKIYDQYGDGYVVKVELENNTNDYSKLIKVWQNIQGMGAVVCHSVQHSPCLIPVQAIMAIVFMGPVE